ISAGDFEGTTYGVIGRANGTTGYLVGGYFESAADNGQGVYGHATGSNGVGIVGTADSSSGYAGYFNGRAYFSDNVGIGFTNPGYQLQLSANSAAKPGSGAWTVPSDARLKKNIEPIQGALDQLMQLHGVTYQWIHPETQGNMAGTYTGMIAQDVEK